jgi:allantoinase
MPSIRSSRVVLPGEVRPATITFAEGRIVSIDDGSAAADYGDLVILPGLVDSHVHVNEPGRTDWEGFTTATDAAAAGGTTTIVDMPLNSIPPTTDIAALGAKIRAATGKLAVDVAFWGGLVPGSLENVEVLAGEGVCGFKLFLSDSGVPEFPPLGTAEMGSALAALAGVGLPALVHAEDPDLLETLTGDPRSYDAYLRSRPVEAETGAVTAVARAATETGATAHILHVSSPGAASVIAESGPMTGETCPHYLTFAAEEIPDGATAYKCAPPIRGRAEREGLWDSLRDGSLAMIVSDHSPAPPESKDLDGGDFGRAWGGIASLELRLPATWTQACDRGFHLTDLARWLAAEPARLAGLETRKGSIEVGKDADLVVFDPDAWWVVDPAQLKQRHPVTPYAGREMRGTVVQTILRGETVVHISGPGGVRPGILMRR